MLVFAADNGVVAEGVSSAPQSVTLKQAINLTKEITGASVLAAHFGCGITVCDVGINADVKNSDVIDKKIAYGTNNIAKGSAMTKEQAIKAIKNTMTAVILFHNVNFLLSILWKLFSHFTRTSLPTLSATL